jgi:hypothetical protein
LFAGRSGAGRPPAGHHEPAGVRRLRLDLEPWRDTQAVGELDEQLAIVARS